MSLKKQTLTGVIWTFKDVFFSKRIKFFCNDFNR